MTNSNMINLTFPDGSVRQFESGVTAYDVAKSIGQRLADAAIAAKIELQLIDMNTKITRDGKFEILTFDSKVGKEIFWHSSAHLLAQAVTELFPKALLTIGPAVDDGFYYDIDHAPFTPEDLAKIEEKMHQIVKANIPISKIEITKTEAKKMFHNNPYKVEMIEEMDGTITAYQQGEFVDLCRGPHVTSTGKIKSLKLTKLAGAYWRADQANKQLQRIYGVSFPDKKLLAEYLTLLEEAQKRDHRKLGKELDLIYFHEYAPGAPFFLPKGTIIYNSLIDFIRDNYRQRGYDEVITPQLYNKKLWETSGHWEHYKEDMFIIKVENEEHSLKPMNCPSHCLIFKREVRSYKNLPFRIADFCCLHRNELSGTLAGLFRVRKFSQDDGHIFCRFDQIEEEVLNVLNFIKYVWEDTFNFKLNYYLSTRPEKCLGTKELWDNAEGILSAALKKANIPFKIKEGDGAFYGPKIDIDLEDALGRKWQCPTCQLDFNLPERFELTYEGEDGKKHRPVMIHRAVLGSLERFMGIMIEHYAGKFPLWLSPVQVSVLTVADRHSPYAQKIEAELKKHNLRVELDTRGESIPKKVRDAQLSKINYILVVGDKEEENHTINVRTRDNIVHGEKKMDQFIAELLKEIKDKQ